MEKIGASIKGIYRDILKDRDNNIIFDSGWTSNLIVRGCRTLLAAFMKNDHTKTVKGVQCLKVGRGDPAWDTAEGPTPPIDSLTGLVDTNPYSIPVGSLDLVYLDESDAEVSGPTNRLQVTAALEAGEPPLDPPLSTYPLREFGLFGEYDGGSGALEYMIDCIRHPVIHKDASATLIRVVRLYF